MKKFWIDLRGCPNKFHEFIKTPEDVWLVKHADDTECEEAEFSLEELA